MGEILTINSARVAHEDMGEEIIAIDIDTGAYFSLRGTAAAAWRAIAAGVGPADLGAAFATAYAGDAAAIKTAIDQLVDALIADHLVILGPGAASAPNLPGGEFAPPMIEKFADHKDLLTLDPIHDVLESGWPHHADRA